MSLLGTRRAAEELDRALGGHTDELGPGTLPLVALGERLRLTGAELEQVAVPREDFRAALRTRLVAVATVQPAPAPAPTGVLGRLGGQSPRRGQKAAGVAAGALAGVVAVSGVAVASTQALPGDAFYGLKRTVEGLQLRVAGDEVDQGDRHLKFAQTRLDEVRELALGRNAELSGAPVAPAPDADWGRVRETLGHMDDETRKGSSLLEQAWREDGDAEALTTLSEFAAQQSAELQQLLPVMAPEARGDAEASLGLVAQVAATTSELLGLGSCTAQCASGGGTPGSGGAGDCDCAPSPSTSPSPSSIPSPPPGSPAPPPAGPAPTTVDPAPDPATAPTRPAPATAPTAPAPPPPSPPSSPLPTLPSLDPTPLPTELTTVAPSLPSSPTPLPVPSLDPELELDDLVPGG